MSCPKTGWIVPPSKEDEEKELMRSLAKAKVRMLIIDVSPSEIQKLFS